MKERKIEGQTLRVTLPGTLYRRGNRWWWCVALPGESKPKPRPLKPKGAKVATSDRHLAEEIAVELWGQTIREQVARQIELQNGEKLATLKAQFLDKVHHFTQIVERATAKAEAEARARAAAEAKLAKLLSGGDPAGAKPVAAPPLALASVPTQNLAPRQEEEDAPPAPSTLHEPPRPETPEAAEPVTIQNLQTETSYCECCTAADTPAARLTRIDSGQWLCPRCLAALQNDATRIQSGAFADCSV